jgi:peptidoglycan/xylan/chitin deacetylase (PgdA/CDA1 family)
LLKARHLKATFFLIGQNVQAHPELVRRIIAEGHEVGNHTRDHPQLSKLSDDPATDEIEKTEDAIRAACGVTPVLLRPPYGALNKPEHPLFRPESVTQKRGQNSSKSGSAPITPVAVAVSGVHARQLEPDGPTRRFCIRVLLAAFGLLTVPLTDGMETIVKRYREVRALDTRVGINHVGQARIFRTFFTGPLGSFQLPSFLFGRMSPGTEMVA